MLTKYLYPFWSKAAICQESQSKTADSVISNPESISVWRATQPPGEQGADYSSGDAASEEDVFEDLVYPTPGRSHHAWILRPFRDCPWPNLPGTGGAARQTLDGCPLSDREGVSWPMFHRSRKNRQGRFG